MTSKELAKKQQSRYRRSRINLEHDRLSNLQSLQAAAELCESTQDAYVRSLEIEERHPTDIGARNLRRSVQRARDCVFEMLGVEVDRVGEGR